MKTKILILAALISAAAMSANAGVRFGISIGLPLPVVYAPAPVTVVQTVTPCPGIDYGWAPGYWSYRPDGRVCISGAWHYRAADHDRGHDLGGYQHDGHDRDHDGYRR